VRSTAYQPAGLFRKIEILYAIGSLPSNTSVRLFSSTSLGVYKTMSQNLSARQQLSNAIVPLVCFSIAILLFAFAGREIMMSLLEEDPVDAQNMQIIMVIVLGVMLLGFISQFVKAYKKYDQEKNAPPRPATPVQPAGDTSAEARFNARQRNETIASPASSTSYSPSISYAPPPSDQVTYSTYGQPSSTRVIEKEKTIIKEIVKIRCSFCGVLADQGLNECPHCGGRL
jgi:hypothetical protein